MDPFAVTSIAVTCLGLIWFALVWHLMNFNVHYWFAGLRPQKERKTAL